MAAVSSPRPDAVGFAIQASPAATSTHPWSGIICNFCGRVGHIKRDCYQLHGYPDGGAQGRGRGFDN